MRPWERIEENGNLRSDRLKIPQGWIVRSIVIGPTGQIVLDQLIVEDPFHNWVLGV